MEIQQIINQLYKEEMNIQDQINELSVQLEEIKTTKEKLIKIKNNLKVNCPECNGKGKKFHRSCAEDDGDWYKCETCNGEGKVRI